MSLAKVNKWLDSRINVEYHKEYSLDITDHFYKSKGIIDNYYSKDSYDSDLENQETELLDIIDSMKEMDLEIDDPDIFNLCKCIQHYSNSQILIKPNTYRFHTNCLFRRIVDYCVENGLVFDNKTIFNKNLKNIFYQFCYYEFNNKLASVTDNEIIDEFVKLNYKLNDKKSTMEKQMQIGMENNNKSVSFKNIVGVVRKHEEMNKNITEATKLYESKCKIDSAINRIWFDVITPYISRTDREILLGLDENDYLKFYYFFVNKLNIYEQICSKLSKMI